MNFSKDSSRGRLRKFCSTFLGLYPHFVSSSFIYLNNLSEAKSKVCRTAAGERWGEMLELLYSSTVVLVLFASIVDLKKII